MKCQGAKYDFLDKEQLYKALVLPIRTGICWMKPESTQFGSIPKGGVWSSDGS